MEQNSDGPESTTQRPQVELTAEQKMMFVDSKRDLRFVVKSGQPITAAEPEPRCEQRSFRYRWVVCPTQVTRHTPSMRSHRLASSKTVWSKPLRKS